MDSNKTAGEEARRQLHKNAASNLEQILAATPHKTPTVRPPAFYHENLVLWLSSQDMDTAIRVQFLDKTDCISHSTNTLGKGMNPIILPPAMGK